MSKNLDGAMDVLPNAYHVCANCGCLKERKQMVHETLRSFCDYACRNAHYNHLAEKG